MQFCDSHIAAMRQALLARGILSAADAPHDPLMYAKASIWNYSVRVSGGFKVMQDDVCPLCQLEVETKNMKTPAKAADWIEPCCDHILSEFQRLGWLPKTQGKTT